MRAHTLVFSLVLGLGAGAGIGVGCAASTNPSGGAGGTGGAGAAGGSGGIGLIGPGGSGGGFDPDAACAKFTAEAKQQSAAIMFVVDGTASMQDSGKWAAVQLATVDAIDKPGFDDTQLGLMRFPGGFVSPPACLCDPLTCSIILPNGVACGVPVLPQVPLADSGTQKSNQGGVRKSIYDYLANPSNGPVVDPSDASPIYDSMVQGYARLKAADVDRRILVLITDGGFSCTSVANPPRPGLFDGACFDWEDPVSVTTLIGQNYQDPDKPVFTFVVGVPGSNSTGAMQGSYATAPYTMLRALSVYAFTGAPDLVPAGCDHNINFNMGAPPPASPCHFDLSGGASLDADTLGNTIADIRGKALGCVYDIPAPPPGETIDLGLVNVNLTLDGNTAALPKRVDPMDTCDAAGCWDLKGTTQIELIGKACSDISNAETAKVDVLVGCQTITK